MKALHHLRRSLLCCLSSSPPTTPTTTIMPTTTTAMTSTPTPTIKNRLSATLTDLFKPQEPHQEPSAADDDDSVNLTLLDNHRRRHRPSLAVGTIFGRRRGHVFFCVQSDPAVPPAHLFELPMPTHLLVGEMRSGLLRIALECHSPRRRQGVPPLPSHSAPPVWKAYCNGRKVGYAVRRRPTENDWRVLKMMQSVSAGAGFLFAGEEGAGAGAGGELLYMRASYETVVGSRDSVSYHLVNPGGGSPDQELSVFLLRTG